MAKKSALMARSSYRAGGRGGGGGASLLILVALVAALIGGVLWYFQLGGPGTKAGVSPYAPTPPTVQINVPRV